MYKTKRLLSGIFLIFFFITSGCEKQKQETSSNATARSSLNEKISLSLAPFDRFPETSKYPLVFRFSAPVAPSNRDNKENFDQLTTSPEVIGKWAWLSDSDLTFTPLDAWRPDNKIKFNLRGLKTAMGLNNAGLEYAPENFEVIFPSASGTVVKCEFEVKNRAPLIQVPKVSVHFSYPVDRMLVDSHIQIILIREGKEENLEKNLSYSKNDLLLGIEGPPIFRPQGASAVKIKIKEGIGVGFGKTLSNSLECELPFSPETWDQKVEELSQEKIEKPIVSLSISSVPVIDSSNQANKMPLKVSLINKWSGQSEPHGRPREILIDQGLKLTPEIKGVWKSDSLSDTDFIFTPESDWAVGQLVKVEINPSLFPDLIFKSTVSEFKTPSLNPYFVDTSFYTDPTDPSKRKVIATLSFSHPVSISELKKYLELKLRVEPEKSFSASVRKLDFLLKADDKSPNLIHVESELLELPSEPGEVRIELKKGLKAINEGDGLARYVYAYLSVPSKKTVFQIVGTSLDIVKRPDKKLERVLSVEFSEPIGREVLLNNLDVLLLPDCKDKKNKKICKDQDQFGDQGAVLQEALNQSVKLGLRAIPTGEGVNPNIFLFALDAPDNRELLVSVKKNLQSLTNFKLAEDYRSLQFVAAFPKELSIMHPGSLLSLSGSKKLGVSLRNISKVEFELSRISRSSIHHLVSITSGDFSKPDFNYGSIGIDQLSERFNYLESFPEMEGGETNYSTIDFEKFISQSGNKAGAPQSSAPRGLFLLTLSEKTDPNQPQTYSSHNEECEDDESCNSYGPIADKRIVLLTDLGIIVKDALNGEHEVFVMSFKTGLPVSGAQVKLIGQNGSPIFSKLSDENGRTQFPKTTDLEREKRPLLYSVEYNDDYSFLPFAREDRRLNLSRFETGGVYNSEEAEGLRALLFSDRGIYRPGEQARFGIIVRKRNLDLAGGIPLEVTITDPRGVEILNKKIALSKLGFEDFYWGSEGALSGTYSIAVNLIRSKGEEQRFLLGSTSFRVEEFQPDKLSVKTKYVDPDSLQKSGWLSKNGAFEVDVTNLFGIPAVGNKVKGKLLVSPWDGSFSNHRGYSFYSQDLNSKLPQEPEDLGELETASDGKIRFVPELDKFSEKAFNLEFAAEAFEKESGRSVVASTNALISNATSFVGWKADGSISYIRKGVPRKVNFLGVDSSQTPLVLRDLSLELVQTKMISALIKKPNGTFGYEMTPKREVLSKIPYVIESVGSEFVLKTDEAGDFTLRILAQDGSEINSFTYQVHGEGTSTFMSDRTSEVGLVLSKTIVDPEEELEISINTPYAGSGLITIEREKVYAAKWFSTDTLSSVQKIKIPKGVVGNAYLSIAFVRSQNSKEIFASPLSYATKPFTIARSEYTANITLSAPEKVIPGTNIEVNYDLGVTGRLLLYAVDEGILQFARYKNPEPVSSFIPKRALEVETFQILDLLLPDQKIVESLSSPGGDEDVGLGKFKNPFGRKRRPPMAFWSGIIGDEKTSGKVNIPVPEYFNGTVRILAVLVSNSKLGVASTKTLVQNAIVIEPQSPYAVSPGDEFEVGATVANSLIGSGLDAKLNASITVDSGLELIDQKSVELSVPEGQDKSFRLKMRAGHILGEKTYKIVASVLGTTVSATESISVRPPQALRTEITAGINKTKVGVPQDPRIIEISRKLYPEQRNVLASISQSPLTLGRSLFTYLKNYPYGCTEQLVSSAFPVVLFGGNADLGLSQLDVDKYTSAALKALGARQRYAGDFGVWDAQSESNLVFSVYATHFLIEAQRRGIGDSNLLLEKALDFLKSLSSSERYTKSEQLAQSYALYLRALNGEVVSTQVKALVSQLNRQWNMSWKDTAIATYLAGAYKIMQMDEDANSLLKRPAVVWTMKGDWPLSSPVFHSMVYGWISSKHFPQSTWLSPLDVLEPVAQMIENKSTNTFDASFAILALEAMSNQLSQSNASTLSIAYQTVDKKNVNLDLFGQTILSGAVPEIASKLVFAQQPVSQTEPAPYFYELSETGYDTQAPKPYSQGLSIIREIKQDNGTATNEFGINDKVEVTLFIKSEEYLSQMAVLEMLPGGVEIDLDESGLASRKSLKPGANTWAPAFIEVQEDRLIFFGDLSQGTHTFTYRLKPLVKGKYVFPAAYAEGMYDVKKKFLGEPGVLIIK